MLPYIFAIVLLATLISLVASIDVILLSLSGF